VGIEAGRNLWTCGCNPLRGKLTGVKAIILLIILATAPVILANESQGRFKEELERIHRDYPIESKDKKAFFTAFDETLQKEIKAGTVGLGKPEMVREIAAIVDLDLSWNENIDAIIAKYPDLADEASHFSILLDAAYNKESERIGADAMKPNMLVPLADAVKAQIDLQKAAEAEEKEEFAAKVAEIDRKFAEKAITERRNEANRQQAEIAAIEAQMNAERRAIQAAEAEAQAIRDQELANQQRGIQAARLEAALRAQREFQDQVQQDQIQRQLEQQRREMQRIRQEMEIRRINEEQRRIQEWQRQQNEELRRLRSTAR
jgi:hypothetical protein